MRRATCLLTSLVLLALMMPAAFPVLAQGDKKTTATAIDPQDRIDADELEGFLDEFFPAKMAELHVPGVTIAFVQDGEILLSKAYGFASYGGIAHGDYVGKWSGPVLRCK